MTTGERVVALTPPRPHRPLRALRDGLTGLGDRRELEQAGADLLSRAASNGDPAVLLLVDVDSLKHLNDSAGHETGDRVLSETAVRLREAIGPDALLVRLGGDEFAALAIVVDGSDCADHAEVLLRSFDRPFEVGELALAVDVSIGFARFPEHGTTIEDLLAAADGAMYVAKAEGGGRWRSAQRGPEGRSDLQARLLADLRSSSLTDQIVVHYQPQVNPGTGEVVGFEALARWQHPELGLLPAREFVPLAEQQHLMRPLTDAVVNKALDALPQLRGAAPTSRLALNMTRRHVLDASLLVEIAEHLESRRLDPDHLLLEISQPVTRAGSTPQPVFERLHHRGIGVSIRGYGKTWSSLTDLWHNPAVREVKLHPQLVQALPTDDRTARLVHALVSGARELGLRVVAEGVETPDVLDAVTALGCDVVQGFLIAAPASLTETLSWVERRA